MTTLKDVAKLAGVTVTTVSRVLNNRGYISAKTRTSVMGAMETLDYQPNELARSLIFQRSMIIGLIVPSIIHPFFSALVNAIEMEASRKSYKILLTTSRHDAEKESSCLDLLSRNKVDGIILASRTLDTRQFQSSRLPLISFDRVLADGIPTVTSDHREGGRLAARHLIDRGCQQLLYIGGSNQVQLLASLRGAGFAEACAAADRPFFTFETEESQFGQLDYEASIQRALDAHPHVDGIFASSDLIAAQVIRVLKARGLSVPKDIRLVGFDDGLIARICQPALTTIHQPVDDLAAQLVGLLEQKIKGLPVMDQTILPVSLVVREST